MPTLREQLMALAPEDRAAAKAEWHRAVAFALSGAQRTFTRGIWTITIADPQRVGNGFQVTVAATRSGVPVPLNNPFVFINPPVCVCNAAGEPVEGVLAAMKEMLAEAIRAAVGEAV